MRIVYLLGALVGGFLTFCRVQSIPHAIDAIKRQGFGISAGLGFLSFTLIFLALTLVCLKKSLFPASKA